MMDDTEIFDIVMDLPIGRREAALREACRGDFERFERLHPLVNIATDEGPTSVAAAAEDVAASESESERLLSEGEHIDQYIVVRFLGQGSFGQVYEAFDLHLRRRVALKILRVDQDITIDDRQQYRREAQALAQIDHSNVVRVWGTGEHRGRPYLTMELIEGTSLDKMLTAQEHPDWRRIVGIMLDAARGLQAAHEAGIVHRDFKPSNVMLTAEGRVVVTDFGIARTFDSRTEVPAPLVDIDDLESRKTTASFIGTPFYMAPEQFHGIATPHSDQYALCLVALESLCPHGERPRLERLETTTPTPESRPALPDAAAPRWLRQILLRGLDPDPDRRHTDIAAFIDQIEGHQRRRRWAIPAFIASVMAVPLLYGALRDTPTCNQWGQDEFKVSVDDMWQQFAAHAAAASGGSIAADQLESVKEQTDGNIDEWARARTEACNAEIRGKTDGPTAAARDICFANWRARLERRMRFITSRPEMFMKADLTEALPQRPGDCGNMDPPPQGDEPLTEEQQIAFDEVLDTAYEHQMLGEYSAAREAIAQSMAVIDSMTQQGAKAQLEHRLGVLAVRTHQPDLAIDLLMESAEIAERHGLEALASEVYTSLAEAYGTLLSLSPYGGTPFPRLARAKREHIDRSLGDRDSEPSLMETHVTHRRTDDLDARLSTIEGQIAHRQGRYADARDAYLAAIEKFNYLDSPVFKVEAVRTNLASAQSMLQEHDEAIKLAEEALKARSALIGAGHPLIMKAHLDLGRIYVRAAMAAQRDGADPLARHRLEIASLHLNDAVRLGRQIYGHRSSQIAIAQSELLNVLTLLRRADEIIAQDLRDCVDIFEDESLTELTDAQRIRGLRLVRNAVFYQGKPDEEHLAQAHRAAAELVELTRNQSENDLLLLVHYEIETGHVDEANHRLQPIEAQIDELRKKIERNAREDASEP